MCLSNEIPASKPVGRGPPEGSEFTHLFALSLAPILSAGLLMLFSVISSFTRYYSCHYVFSQLMVPKTKIAGI